MKEIPSPTFEPLHRVLEQCTPQDLAELREAMKQDETALLQRSYYTAISDLLAQARTFASFFAPYGPEWAKMVADATGVIQDPALAESARENAQRQIQAQEKAGWDTVVALVRQTVWIEMLQELLDVEMARTLRKER